MSLEFLSDYGFKCKNYRAKSSPKAAHQFIFLTEHGYCCLCNLSLTQEEATVLFLSYIWNDVSSRDIEDHQHMIKHKIIKAWEMNPGS